MKILLIGINARYTHTNLAIRRLCKANIEKDAEVCFKEYSINMEAEDIAEDILAQNADAIGFSVYIWNSSITKEIIGIIRRVFDRNIFCGGPEASFSPDAFLKDELANAVLFGEGENSFPEYVSYLLGKKDIAEVHSLIYIKDGIILRTETAMPVDMEDLPEPYGFEDKLLNDHRVIYYESMRGCPFACAYCLSGADMEKSLRVQSAKKTIHDMELYAKNGIKHIKFVDRTFNADIDYAKTVWKSIAEMDCNTEFHFEIAADLLDEEAINIINTAPKKRIRLEIGVQSTYEPTLEAINRFQDVKYIEKTVKLLRKGNANVHLDLIAGLPFEDKERFKKSLDDTMSFGANEVQLGFLKLLKGSPLYPLAERFGIVADENAPYEVIRTKWLNEADIEELKKVEYALGRIYNGGLFRNTLRLLARESNEDKRTDGIFYGSYYSVLLNFANEYDIKPMGESRLAEALLDFGTRRRIVGIRDAIRYDMMKKDRRPFLPESLEDGISDIKREFYKHINIEGMKKGKRPWNYSRIEYFSYDMVAFEMDGVTKKLDGYLFFDYINGKTYYADMDDFTLEETAKKGVL